MFGNRSCERVLDRDNGDGNSAGLDQVENFNRARARNDGATLDHAPSGFVTEGPGFSLDGNFHSSKLAGRLYGKQILLEQQGVKPIGIIMRNDFDDVVSMVFVEGNC